MKLKEYLKKNKVTQAALARKVGTSKPHMSRIIKGTTPSVVLMKRIERATKGQVTIEELIQKEPPSRLKSEYVLD